MKALTLTQPWATLVAIGAKRIETRSWRFEGIAGQTIAIHAAKGLAGIKGGEAGLEEICNREPFRSALEPHIGRQLQLVGDPDAGPSVDLDVSLLPRGEIVCLTRVLRVIPLMPITDGLQPMPPEAQEHELDFGAFGPGRIGYVLAPPRRTRRGFQVRGEQGFWNWDTGRAAAQAAA